MQRWKRQSGTYKEWYLKVTQLAPLHPADAVQLLSNLKDGAVLHPEDAGQHSSNQIVDAPQHSSNQIDAAVLHPEDMHKMFLDMSESVSYAVIAIEYIPLTS